MNPLKYQRASSWKEASSLVSTSPKNELQAAGIDNMDRMKEGGMAPNRLISLLRIPVDNPIDARKGKPIQLSSLVTLSEIGHHPTLSSVVPALTEAAGTAATLNIRNAATLGGNLCQSPHCSYFRASHVGCVRNGGTICPAIEGDNVLHGVFENAFCAAVLPSSVAVALTALDAEIQVVHHEKEPVWRPIDPLYQSPTRNLTNHISLNPGEIISAVRIPKSCWKTRNNYYKIRPRSSFDWPLIEVAVSLREENQVITQCQIVLGAVAMTPWRATVSETFLIGKPLRKETIAAAAEQASVGATPLSGNAYKLSLMKVAVRRTLEKTLTNQQGGPR